MKFEILQSQPRFAGMMCFICANSSGRITDSATGTSSLLVRCPCSVAGLGEKKDWKRRSALLPVKNKSINGRWRLQFSPPYFRLAMA